ncbi:hypothetical protein [Campylobacter troglodytis]|nr:hypothetical protein [Campylobacter troglodytis]
MVKHAKFEFAKGRNHINGNCECFYFVKHLVTANRSLRNLA